MLVYDLGFLLTGTWDCIMMWRTKLLFCTHTHPINIREAAKKVPPLIAIKLLNINPSTLANDLMYALYRVGKIIFSGLVYSETN